MGKRERKEKSFFGDEDIGDKVDDGRREIKYLRHDGDIYWISELI